ncbi:flagellar motor protein MotB [Desulfotalea psychrophila]|nr:flagellar motor protein MotB [Desulfocapsa sp.]MBN4071742.1 flagellar motor protein MotB [Desulfotalea psychrophila]
MADDDKKIPQEVKCPKCVCVKGAPAWMTTFADLVTLLLTFFVLLLSMANMEEIKFAEASASIRSAFGAHSLPAPSEFSIPIIPSPPISKFSPIQNETASKVYKRIQSQLKSDNIPEDVELIKKEDDTIILRINDAILFKKGSSVVSPTAYSTLRNLADIIRPLPMRLRIEGHTDSTPFSKRKISNWNLSTDRAVSIMRFFKKSNLLPLDRMSAVGYGADRPVVPNTNETNMAKNRRVDFVLRTNNTKGIGAKGTKAGELPL